MKELILNNLDVIITGLLTLLTALFGGGFVKFKTKLNAAKILFDLIVEAIQDDKVTDAELKAIINQAKKLFPNIGKKSDKEQGS